MIFATGTKIAPKSTFNAKIVQVAIVDDDPVFNKLLFHSLEKNNFLNISRYSSGEDFLKNLYRNPEIVIVDYKLPDLNGLELIKRIKSFNDTIKTILVSGQSDVGVVVQAYKGGADDYIVKNMNCLPEVENSIKNLSHNVLLRKEIEELKSEILDRNKYDRILGNSHAILKVLRLIEKAEKSNILVLITGDSGTGKELVASAIHANSPRRKKPFVAVNMAAIPKDLIESELFGHEKGAFTGALSKRLGKFEEANEGTIFLDEIGEMDLALQAKILRVLEERQVTRVGTNKITDLDIKIIAATNKDLSQEVKKGNFREDLYYRLQGFLIHLPALRDRKDDVMLLAKNFLKEFCRKNNLSNIVFSKEAIDALMNYSWPGNVRELKSVIERAALLCSHNTITPQDVMISNVSGKLSVLDEELTLEDYKNRIIQLFLEKYNNNVDIVAKKLNVGRATVYRYLKKLTT